jgi:hypothetical protein
MKSNSKSNQKGRNPRGRVSQVLAKFLVSNWAIITGTLGGGFAFYKFILDRSVPANIQLSLDTSVESKKEQGQTDAAHSKKSGDGIDVEAVAFSVKASNDSPFRDLKIHDNFWVAYGWDYSAQGGVSSQDSRQIYDLHRQAEYIYGDPILYAQHIKKTNKLLPADKSRYLKQVEDWQKKGKIPPGRIDDATKRRLAGYSYLRELIGVGTVFSPDSELRPGQQIEAHHTIPVDPSYDAVEIRVLMPTSEPGRRQGWLGLVGKTDEILEVSLMTFDYGDRAQISNPQLMPRMCEGVKCLTLSERQMKNLRYQSQVITSQIWLAR